MKTPKLSPESETVPRDLLIALCQVKKALAQANSDAGKLDREKAHAIAEACDALTAGKVDAETRISLWDSANGQETHRIMSDILARRATDRLGKALISKGTVHPVDELSLGQTAAEAYATAMNVAAGVAINRGVIPAVQALRDELDRRAQALGHLDRWVREFSSHVSHLDQALTHLHFGLPHLYDLPVSSATARELARWTGLPFVGATHPSESTTSTDGIVHMHGALKGLASTLLRIARDLKVNLSGENPEMTGVQVYRNDLSPLDSLRMAGAQILGNDVTIGLAGAFGRETHSPFLPVMIHAFLQSTRLIAERLPILTTRLVARIQEASVPQKLNPSASASLNTNSNGSRPPRPPETSQPA